MTVITMNKLGCSTCTTLLSFVIRELNGRLPIFSINNDDKRCHSSLWFCLRFFSFCLFHLLLIFHFFFVLLLFCKLNALMRKAYRQIEDILLLFGWKFIKRSYLIKVQSMCIDHIVAASTNNAIWFYYKQRNMRKISVFSIKKKYRFFILKT